MEEERNTEKNRLATKVKIWIDKLDQHPTRQQIYYFIDIRDLFCEMKEIKKMVKSIPYEYAVRKVDYKDLPALDSITLAKEFLKENDVSYREEKFDELWNKGSFDFQLMEDMVEDGYDINFTQKEEPEISSAWKYDQSIFLTFNHNIVDAISLVHEWFHINEMNTHKKSVKEELLSELSPIYAEFQFLLWLKEKDPSYEKIVQRNIYLRMKNSSHSLDKALVQTAILCSCIDQIDLLNQSDEVILKTAKEKYLSDYSDTSFQKYSKMSLRPENTITYVFGTLLACYAYHQQIPLSKVYLANQIAHENETEMDDVYEMLELPKNFSWYQVTSDAIEGMEELLFPPKRKQTEKGK